MTKAEYEKEQAKLQKYEEACMKQAQKSTRKRLEAMAKEALETGEVNHDSLTADLDSIYKFYKDMAANKASELAKQYVEGVIKELKLKPKKKPDYIETATKTGYGEWYKLPDGKTVFIMETQKLEFLRKYHLSMETLKEYKKQVWAVHDETAAEAEERVFTVIDTG